MTKFTEDKGVPSYEQMMAAGNRLAAELDASSHQLEALGEQGQLIDNFDAVLQWRKLLKQVADYPLPDCSPAKARSNQKTEDLTKI